MYKAPKRTNVEFEEDAKANKKARQQEMYERKRISKSKLVIEMQQELNEEPEELFDILDENKENLIWYNELNYNNVIKKFKYKTKKIIINQQ